MVKEFVHESRYDHTWSSCVRAYFLRYPNPNASHILSVDVIDRRIEHRPVGWEKQPLPSSSTVEGHTTIPVLCTTRLILKRGTLPKWAPSGLIKNAESWVMEESEVELDLFPPKAGSKNTKNKSLMGRSNNGRAMRSWTRNLDHTTVLAITEGLVFKERFGFIPSSEDVKGKGKGKEVDSALQLQSGNLVWSNFCKTITTSQIESQVGFGMLRRRIEKFGLARFIAHKDTSQEGIMWVRDQLCPGPSSLESGPQHQRTSISEKKIKILESLRPPFLDGYPLGPIQKLKLWWFSGHYSQIKKIKDGYPISSEEDEAMLPEGQDQGLVRYQGVPDEDVFRNRRPKAGQGVVYSEEDRTPQGGVLNRLKESLGLPPAAWLRFKDRLEGLRAANDPERLHRDKIDSQRTV